MKSKFRLHHIVCFLVLLASPLSAAPRRAISTGFEYSSGKYGGDTASKTWATGLTVERTFGPFSLGVSRSYLWITNPGVSIPGIGPVQEQALARLATTNPKLASLLGRNATTSTATTTTAEDEKVNGFGDTYVYGTWTFKELGKSGLVPSLGAEVKFGTANADKGLGTGENDYSLTAGLSKDFEGQGIVVDAGYQFLGDPEGLDLKNGAFATLTYWREVGAKGTLEGTIDWCGKTSADVDDSASLLVRYTHSFTEKMSVSISAGTGLTDASPDFTTGASFRFAF